MEDHKSIKRRVVTNNAGLTSIPKSQLNYARTKIQRKKRDFLKRINYFNTFSVVVLPALVLLYFFICRQSIEWPKSETVIFSFLYFNVTLLAFTAGYHKYFTHNSFQTESLTLQWFFAVFGSSLGLGSVRWWAALHRAHHQYTDDTERDPYSIKRGSFGRIGVG